MGVARLINFTSCCSYHSPKHQEASLASGAIAQEGCRCPDFTVPPRLHGHGNPSLAAMPFLSWEICLEGNIEA